MVLKPVQISKVLTKIKVVPTFQLKNMQDINLLWPVNLCSNDDLNTNGNVYFLFCICFYSNYDGDASLKESKE